MAIPAFRIDRMPEGDGATFGQLVDDEERIICKTVEKRWLDNHHDTSCIPAGTYFAHRRLAKDTRHGYDVFELEGVPDRANIQIHIANVASELLGCIALGTEFALINGQHGVANSRLAYAAWMKRNAGVDRIQVTITNPAP